MLRYPLNRHGKSQQFRLLEPCCRYDLRDGRSSFRERAGLVDHKRVDLLHMLKRLGILDENAEPRAPAEAYNDRHRRRQAQSAGTGDDKHGAGSHPPVGEARIWTPNAPCYEACNSNEDGKARRMTSSNTIEH